MRGKNLWALLKEPKFVSAMLVTSYSLAGLIGLILLTFPPIDVVEHSNHLITNMIGVFFCGASIAGIISLHGGDWWLERACIYALWAGMVLYMIIIWDFDSDFSERIIRTFFAMFIIAHLAARFYKIRGLTLDPTK